jgi:hypothetical protein
MRAVFDGMLLGAAALLLAALCLDRLPDMTDESGRPLRRRTLWEAAPWLLHADHLCCSSCGDSRAAEDLYLYGDQPHWWRFVCIGCDKQLEARTHEARI